VKKQNKEREKIPRLHEGERRKLLYFERFRRMGVDWKPFVPISNPKDDKEDYEN
tara:strand:+ start:11360 stop:11521 length:162 start_codon:yes stop_codon:yes gene_type:complete